MTILRDSAIEEAVAALAAGRLVAFPTETVYGLGADSTSDTAVARVYEAKGRPTFNPLIAHVPDLAAAERLVAFSEPGRQLARAFWPGPLTLVLPRQPDCPVSLLASAGLDTLAVRVPDHPLALRLLGAFGRPLVAPSANLSGQLSPTAAAHVREALGDKVALVLDGGPCRVGVESTVIGLSGARPALLRPGGVPAEAVEAIVGALEAAGDGPLRSPGQLDSHYAPALPVRLEATAARPGEALLAFGPRAPTGAAATLDLSPTGDLAEAAANLFAFLRRLDRSDLDGIAVMPIPERGLGRAINDRLRRAAAPRPGTPGLKGRGT
ncbi:MAG: threonylcarbamoyl-AMP synthase [Alphaproteobacteria bacterium]|nr:threonylcarbamoyl-AMP synthase [Alphaproteobacteria bacterium]